jgi:hypothetical protein
VLLAALVRLDDDRHPVAETNRRLGAFAEENGLTRPSYEQVRVNVRLVRLLRQRPTMSRVLVDVAFRVKPWDAILDHLAGTDVYYRK